jgi:sarcosine oxidase delta subunit
MALIKCPDCEKMISPRVQQCPFCGCPSEFFGDSGDNSIQSSNNGSEAESDSVNSD